MKGFFKIGSSSYLNAHNVYRGDKLKKSVEQRKIQMLAMQNLLLPIFVNINDNKTVIEKLRNRKRQE
ncbi:hypothetical protein DEM91_02120 [Prevotella sp. TCVGH]|nr:hypothetical protein [Prevotella sp. TCVGH]